MESAMMLNFSKSSAEMVETAEAGGNFKVGAPPKPARDYEAKDGTPETAAAALGTAHEVRVRKAEQWAAARKRKTEEGGKWGRKRGKGAQLRRQVKKRQEVMDAKTRRELKAASRDGHWWRQQQQRDQVVVKGDKQLLGEMMSLQRGCDRKVAKADEGRAERVSK